MGTHTMYVMTDIRGPVVFGETKERHRKRGLVTDCVALPTSYELFKTTYLLTYLLT